MAKKGVSENVDWWKICEHPLVQGLHRIFTLIGAPVVVIALVGAWNAFAQMQKDISRLNVLVDVSLGRMDKRQDRFDVRVQDLERGIVSGRN